MKRKNFDNASRIKGGAADNKAMPSCLVFSLVTPFLNSQNGFEKARLNNKLGGRLTVTLSHRDYCRGVGKLWHPKSSSLFHLQSICTSPHLTLTSLYPAAAPEEEEHKDAAATAARRGSRRCSVAAGAEGRESGLGVGSLRGPGAAVPPELWPSIPGRYWPLGEGLFPSASSGSSTSMVVKLAPGSARHQAASFAPSSSWGASLAPAHGHLRRHLLSPAEPTPGGGRGRGSLAGALSSRATTGTIGE
ncbi:uncharacterized protein LOC122477072 [Prionailurus bengalensis]|uniref:uncharacterized protein LOC122477072 n=1 Tax=Prionailurus bengalensis TaxID=37029 RepID=UPI001CA92038|nr:uncharacterized protein LOC122477072 [Prionailurus bengalensis]